MNVVISMCYIVIFATNFMDFRIPDCFLLLGGMIASLSIVGLLLVKEPKQTNSGVKQHSEKHQQTANLGFDELPSLGGREVLKTSLFYKVNNITRYLIHRSNSSIFRCISPSLH